MIFRHFLAARHRHHLHANMNYFLIRREYLIPHLATGRRRRKQMRRAFQHQLHSTARRHFSTATIETPYIGHCIDARRDMQCRTMPEYQGHQASFGPAECMFRRDALISADIISAFDASGARP